MGTDLHQARLRWQCRRGMLELDLILSNFCEKFFNQLEPGMQEDFSSLLSHSDQELYDWLILNIEPTILQLCPIIRQIRSTQI